MSEGEQEEAGTEATKREGQGTSAPRHDTPRQQTEKQEVPQLTRGTLVGRYVVLDVLGEGGMGVVYAAFDPELDRKVAVKLLQAKAGGSVSGGQAWLTREAQAMARLSHPNVIAVYDVGSLPGDRVFVAMELVDGGTMRTWLDTEHPWRDVIAVMRAAGGGLAAAHAAGLVHRDFKPDNVLIGKDGRVRVMDFGLARLDTNSVRDSDLSIEKYSPLQERLTVAGTVVGTPAYMAPEIYREEPAGPSSDQFAFGVTLYEALYRARPYTKKELRSGDAKPKPPPASSKVPARVHRAVMRAISIDPAQRFPSMEALIAELGVDPLANRKRAIIAVAAGLVIGGVVIVGLALTHGKDEVCKGAERKLAGAWDAPTKQTIQQAFAATRHVHADGAFAAVTRALDRYTGDWTHTAIESCEATRVHRDQSEADMQLRLDCLDQRLAEVRALTQLFAKADSATVDKAEQAANNLDSLAGCSNLPLLRAPGLAPPEAAPHIRKLNDLLASAKAAILANKVGAGIVSANEAVKEAKASNFDPAMAEAMELQGVASFSGGDPFGAIDQLREAAVLSIKGHRDDVLADTALFCAIASSQARKDDVAAIWLSIGIAAASKVTGNRVLDIRRYQTEGIVLARQGDTKGAIVADLKALELASDFYGKDGGMAVAQAEQELASAYSANFEYVKALPHLEHGLALITQIESPDHPDVATALGTVAMIYAHLGDTAKARSTYEQAIGIRERTLGTNSPALVPTLNNVADMLNRMGDARGALPYIERALPIAEKFGKNNAMYQTIATTYTEILFNVGRQADGRRISDDLLAAEESGHSQVLWQTLTSRADSEVQAGKFADGATFATRAITAIELSAGKDSPLLWPPLAALAEAKVGLGKPAEARPLFERAFAIAKAAQTSDTDLARAKAAYSKLK
jgi:tetratricopeptide (TPR) repeat protein